MEGDERDGGSYYQCLGCKGDFGGRNNNWKYCPLCGLRWDCEHPCRPHTMQRWEYEKYGECGEPWTTRSDREKRIHAVRVRTELPPNWIIQKRETREGVQGEWTFMERRSQQTARQVLDWLNDYHRAGERDFQESWNDGERPTWLTKTEFRAIIDKGS